MLHQLVTVNYYHLTLGREARPPLRRGSLPGLSYRRMPQPGFRWNILDFGGGGREEIDYDRVTTMAGNVFSRPLSRPGSAARPCSGGSMGKARSM
eukprot:2500893-Prymnesium_polylepis.1